MSWRFAIMALVCGLTLAASGDDVCLLRLVPESLPAKAVFLDDPNADFTASDDCGPTFTSGEHFSPVTPCPVTTPSRPALTVDSLCRITSPATPLRC